MSSTCAKFAVCVHLSDSCQDGLDHVIADGAGHNGLALCCCVSGRDSIQTGLSNISGKFIQNLRCSDQKDSENSHHFLQSQQCGALCFIIFTSSYSNKTEIPKHSLTGTNSFSKRTH